MNIAKLFVDAIRAQLIGYVVIAQITVKAVIVRGMDEMKALIEKDCQQRDDLIEDIISQLIMDERSRYVIEPIVVTVVAQYLYYNRIGRYFVKEGVSDMNTCLLKASDAFRNAVEDGGMAGEGMAEISRLYKPIHKYVIDNLSVAKATNNMDDPNGAFVTVARLLDGLLMIMEGAHQSDMMDDEDEVHDAVWEESKMVEGSLPEYQAMFDEWYLMWYGLAERGGQHKIDVQSAWEAGFGAARKTERGN